MSQRVALVVALVLAVIAAICNAKMKRYSPMQKHYTASGDDWSWMQKEVYSENDFLNFRVFAGFKWASIGAIATLLVLVCSPDERSGKRSATRYLGTRPPS